jgi:hypothetical protein
MLLLAPRTPTDLGEVDRKPWFVSLLDGEPRSATIEQTVNAMLRGTNPT